jgi:parvulin-like peptidyl-prolyl isomerase
MLTKRFSHVGRALAAAFVLTLALAACGGGDDGPADVPADAIAVVGDTPIPKADFDALMSRAQESYESQEREFPAVGTPEYQDLQSRAVAFLVQRYRFQAEAEALDIEVAEAEVDERLDQIREESFEGDEARFEEALEAEGLTVEQAREEIRAQLLQEKLFEQVTEDVEVSDEDVAAYYEENEEQFTQPASRDVRHILVKNKARADEIHAELENGGNFAQLARRYSQDTGSKKAGGKLPVQQGSTVPPFDEAAFELDTNELSEPVKTTFGWHIIMPITDVEPAEVTPFEDVEERIREQLESERSNSAVETLTQELEKKYPATYAAGFEPAETDPGTTGEEPAEDGDTGDTGDEPATTEETTTDQ